MGKSRNPFQPCATPYCCFCFDFGPDITCYMIAILCIVVNGFMWRANFGIGHLALYVMSILTFLVYLLAGILLFLGTSWEKNNFKDAYCWLCLLGLLCTIIGLVLAIVFYKSSYIVWGRGCHEIFDGAEFVVLIVHVCWLVLWSLYTPMIVLGNKTDDDAVSIEI